MRIRRTSSHAIGGAAVTALGLAALVLVTGSLEARPAQAQANARTPLRAVFIVTAPGPARRSPGRPAPTGPQAGAAALKAHLAALDWAGADGAIVPWSRGSSADRRFGKVLAAVASRKAHVRVAALVDRGRCGRADPGSRPVASEEQELPADRLATRRLRRAANRRLRTCAAARRWRAAAKSCTGSRRGRFPDTRVPRPQPTHGFVDRAGLAVALRATGTFLIRPGYWPSRAEHAALPRAAARWRRAIEADECLEGAAPVDRLAQRLAARNGDRARGRMALRERVRHLPR